MKINVQAQLTKCLNQATNYGLFPIIGYAIEGNNLLLLTTSIPDLALAVGILREVSDTGYNLGKFIPGWLAEKLATENPHVMRLTDTEIDDLQDQELKDLGRVVSVFGAPFYEKKAFGLVDIVGFTRLNNADQLAYLYSLNNLRKSAIRRATRFCDDSGIESKFGKTSTGDGFYVWHDDIGWRSDVATFMVLVCMMLQVEAMRSAGFSIRLKASFVIEAAFMLYDTETEDPLTAVADNAVGPATNIAARLLVPASPSQILVHDFRRPETGTTIMTPTALLQKSNELFSLEDSKGGNLAFDPVDRLRVVDKHGDNYYCWNLVGDAPNYTKGEKTQRIAIGVRPDHARRVSETVFESEPTLLS